MTKLKKIDFDDVEINDIIILEHKNGKEIIVGELIDKYKSNENHDILNGKENDPRKWLLKKHVPDCWFLTIRGSFTKCPNESFENKLSEYGVSSNWFDCYIYDFSEKIRDL